jgi:CBS domain containing-hemolysin-like protein
MDNLLLVFGALLLVFLNGFFVALEFGLVKVRSTRYKTLEHDFGWRGRLLVKVHRQLDVYLSACQLGITLASLGLGWIGEPAFADLLDPLFKQWQIASPALIHSISFAIAFCTISFLHIVVGEQAPKSMAIRNPESMALWGVAPLYAFYWLMFPAIWLLNASSIMVLRVAGLNTKTGHDKYYSAEEIQLILRSGRANQSPQENEWDVATNALEFSQLEVSELMRPIHEMTALYQQRSLKENMAIVSQSRFSRYPYFAENNTDILGVIHLKDLFLAMQRGQQITNLQRFLRPIQYVPAHMPALDLFRQLTQGAPHFVVVGQPGEKPRGFLTLDNLLTSIVGEIKDEFRQSDTGWQKADDGTLSGKGSLPIFSLERALGIDIENEALDLEDVDTVGGLILAQLQDIPETGQVIRFHQFRIEVEEMVGARIESVKVYPKIDADDGIDDED